MRKALTFAEEVLNKASNELRNVKEISDAVATLKEDVGGLHGLSYDKDRVMSSHIPDLSEQVERMEERCEALDRRLALQKIRAFWARQLIIVIAGMLETYDKNCSAVVIAHWANGLRYEEIASQRGVGVATIYRLRRLAIRELNDYHSQEIKASVDAADVEISKASAEISSVIVNDSK